MSAGWTGSLRQRLHELGQWRPGGATKAAQLLLRPRQGGLPGAENPLQWLVLEAGQPVASGQIGVDGDGVPDTQWRALPTTFILPSSDVSYFDLAAPPGLKPAEWPLLLEEQLCVAAPQVEIGCVSRTPGRLQLQLADKALLQQWEARCQALALVPERYVSDFQLLPLPDAGHYRCWRHDNELTLILPDTGADETSPRWRWLNWTADADLPTSCQTLQRSELQAAPGELDWQVLAAGISPELPPLRRGTLKRRQAMPLSLSLVPLKPLRSALVVLLVCGLAYLGAERWQQGQRAAAARQQVLVQLQVPANASVERATRLLAARLDQQQAALGRLADLALFSDSVAGWLAQQPGLRVQRFAYDNNDGNGKAQLLLAASVEGAADAVDAQRLQQMLAQTMGIDLAAGLSVQLQDAEAPVRIDYQIAGQAIAQDRAR